MTYRNEIHGLNHDGDRLSARGATLPAVTADSLETTTHAGAPTVGAPIVIDLEYLGQTVLERRLAAGEPLPDGVTAGSLAAWREAHPDYDPAAPLGGQQIPGVTVTVGGVPPLPAVGDGGGDGHAVAVVTCPAATGLPNDPAHPGRCAKHADGVHRCAKLGRHVPPANVVTATPAVAVALDSRADHRCACEFVWISATGGVEAFTRQAERVTTSTIGKFSQAVLRMLTAEIDDPETLATVAAKLATITVDWSGGQQ